MLHDYRFAYDLLPPGETFAGASVRPKNGETVYGVLWEVAHGDIDKLDVDEDVPRDYTRVCLPVFPCRGAVQQKSYAWVYVGQPSALTPTARPEAYYVELLTKGARAHGFPKAYVDHVIRQFSHPSPRGQTPRS